MALFNCKTKLNELIQLRAKFMCNIHNEKLNAIGIGSNESDIYHLKVRTDYVLTCMTYSSTQNAIINLIHTTPV